MTSRSFDFSLLPHSVSRRLRTLGHALTRLEAAVTVLQRRCAKGHAVQGMTPDWFRSWGGTSVIGTGSLVDFTQPWPAAIEQRDYEWLAAGFDKDQDLSLSWAVALLFLHLPVLRAFWHKELRAHRAGLLQRVLPRVWPLDPSPLPPGAVISGLNLSSWSQLPSLVDSGRTFEVLSLTGKRQNVTAATWPDILTQAHEEKILLVEHRHLPEGSAFTASWSRNEQGWIDLDQQTL